MSRILAQSVTADLCGRLFNRLLFILLFPVIMLIALIPAREKPLVQLAPSKAAAPGAVRPLRPQGDLKPGP